MKPFSRLLALSLFLFLVFLTAPAVLADSKSDYEYQYGRYRQTYPEYQLLRRDYLATPSLDNQQKALLSVKQTLLARDLTKASFAGYLLDLIGSYQISGDSLQPFTVVLTTSRQYFLDQSQKSQTIVTEGDLQKFTTAYLKSVPENDSYLKIGIVAYKIAGLMRIQQDSKIALENLIPKLPTPLPAGLSERLSYLRDRSAAIDSQIDLLVKNLNLKDSVPESVSEIFFTNRIEKLARIRTLQLDWINLLIDIDLNYAQI